MPTSAIDLTAGNSAVDLSRLPPPAVVAELSFETTLDQRLAFLQEQLGDTPGFDALLESDPAVKLQESDAYRELLAYAQINDAARSVMLAFARGADLDHLGAFYNVARHELAPATDAAAAILEADDSLRRRIQLAPEELARTGLTGGHYASRAKASSAKVADVATIKRGGGQVDIVLLGRDGDGALETADVVLVAGAFMDEAAVQLTDIVNVRAATIVPFKARVTLSIAYGPDKALITAAADKAVRAYAARQHKVGRTIVRQMIEAAASVSGVDRATAQLAIADGEFAGADVIPGETGAAYLDGLDLIVEVVA